MINLSSLNPEQLSAVTAPLSPVCVLAGPGSGKTRVLTYRAAYAMDHFRIAPWQLLALTFTRKAADEMKSRLVDLVGENRAGRICAGTFHAMGARILGKEAERIGYSTKYKIVDEVEAKALMQRILNDSNQDREFTPDGILAQISRAKGNLLLPGEITPESDNDVLFIDLYKKFQDELRRLGYMDFSDLIFWPVRIFAEHPDVAQSWADRYGHVLVDEFQDTDSAQYELLKFLTFAKRDAFVVGDVDQSIYGWRGAQCRNIHQFIAQYEAQKIILDRNYRSRSKILETAIAAIQSNADRFIERLTADRGEGGEVVFMPADDPEEEAGFVAGEIEQLISSGTKPGDIAVLYRINALSRAFEEELLSRGIPHRVLNGTRFYERKEIRDLVAYLTLVRDPDNAEAFNRILNTPPRGIGNVAVSTIARESLALGCSGISLIQMWAERDLSRIPLTKRQALEVSRLGKQFAEWRHLAYSLNAGQLLEKILEDIGYKSYLQKDRATEEGLARWENVQELVGIASGFVMVKDFLTHVGQMVASSKRATGDEEGSSAVSLITIHGAKGLEFKVVFLVGLADGILPHSRSLDNQESLEEERRLLYVGITRAEDLLYLTFSARRNGSDREMQPSRFLDDLPDEIFESE